MNKYNAFIHFLVIIEFCDSINVIVYSPSFASSHMNFMAHIADTLTNFGHNVTFLVPIADESKKQQQFVKTTRDIYLVEQDEEMRQTSVPMDKFNERFWRSDSRAENIYETLTPFNDLMKKLCDNFYRNPDVFEDMERRNFDVAIAEPVSVCGLGFFKKLGIEKVILASSCIHFDFLFPYIGEPLDLSYVPSLFSNQPENMSLLGRYENMQVATEVSTVFYSAFDDEMKIYRKHLGNNMADWRDLLPAASLYFTNSNPYIDFPRPAIHKTVPIGGISVDMEFIKSQNLPEEWDEVLSRRSKTMLISFGSLIRSIDMPKKYRQNILNVIKSFPDVTFIWKYESENDAFASEIDNIYLSKWVPQTALLADSRLSAFMTHGGLGSTNELAYCGKPAIMIPIFADQARNTNMLSQHHGVIVVRKNELGNRQIIQNAVYSILNDKSYHENAQKLANLLQNQPMNPKQLVVKHTEFVAKYGPFPHMDPHTFLVPISDESLRDQLHVKLTKDVYLVERDEEMIKSTVPLSKGMDAFWHTDIRTENVAESHGAFHHTFKTTCENFLRNSEVFDEMKKRNFDVAISEPLDMCGLGFFKKLGIDKTIIAASCVHYDYIFPYIGEPNDFSYVPALISDVKEEMGLLDRFENLRLARELNVPNEALFDDLMKLYRKHLGEDIPDWRELVAEASLYFTNSNPYVDFPRPAIQKTVPVGGISVDMEYIKSQKLSKEWDEVLNKRNKTMFISFGTLARSISMPLNYRQSLLSVIKSFPDVTFIWKYESEDTAFASGVDNIYFSKWVPQPALLLDSRLTAFLTHGGLGSINELAYCGKPAVIIPIFGDQLRNANMLGRHKGSIVHHKKVLGNEEALRNSIRSILEDESYSKNARKLAEIIEHQPLDPKDLVVKYTEFVAKFGPFPQMDPYGRHLNYFQKNFLDIYAIFGFFYIVIALGSLAILKNIYTRVIVKK